jgi:hypothetical protein
MDPDPSLQPSLFILFTNVLLWWDFCGQLVLLWWDFCGQMTAGIFWTLLLYHEVPSIKYNITFLHNILSTLYVFLLLHKIIQHITSALPHYKSFIICLLLRELHTVHCIIIYLDLHQVCLSHSLNQLEWLNYYFSKINDGYYVEFSPPTKKQCSGHIRDEIFMYFISI